MPKEKKNYHSGRNEILDDWVQTNLQNEADFAEDDAERSERKREATRVINSRKTERGVKSTPQKEVPPWLACTIIATAGVIVFILDRL